MVQESNNKNNSDELFDARSAVGADDVFLNHVEAGLEKLPTFHDDYVKMEYHKCCENARHTGSLRNDIMQFWATFCAILFIAIGTSIGQFEKRPFLGLTFMAVIGLAGCIITILTLMMEMRAMDYYAQWCRRCRVLEVRMGFYGQYWRTYVKLVVPPKKISRRTTMRLAYCFGIVLWAATLVWALVMLVQLDKISF